MASRSQLRSVVSDAQTRGREAVARGREAVEAVSEVRDNMSDALDRSLERRPYTTLAMRRRLDSCWEPCGPVSSLARSYAPLNWIFAARRSKCVNEDRITGNAEKLVGQVQEGVGQLAGDARDQIQGRVKQVEGAIGDLYGQAKQTALA